jgi:hypothetical protein
MNTDDKQPRRAFARLEAKESCWIFCNLAHGYLQTAVSALDGLPGLHEHGGVYSLLPIMFDIQHGLELFLKGATLFHEATPAPTHDLRTLAGAYNCCVTCPQRRIDLEVVGRAAWLDDWCKARIPHYRCGTAARYLHDTDHVLMLPGVSIDESWLRSCAKGCREECVRIHLLMIQASGPGSDTTIVHLLQPWWEPAYMFQERLKEATRQTGVRGQEADDQ